MRRTQGLISLILITALSAGSLGAFARQADAAILREDDIVISDTSDNEDESADYEAAEEYIYSVLSDNNHVSVSSYAYRALMALNYHNELDIYDILCEEIKKIASGERQSTEIVINVQDLSKYSFTAADLGLQTLLDDQLNLSQEACQRAYEYLFNQDTDRITYMLLYSLPYDLYWFDKVDGLHFSRPSQSVSNYNRLFRYENGQLVASGNMTYKFAVAEEYRISQFEIDSSFPDSLHQAKNRINSIIDQYKDYDDIDKLNAYKNEICDRVDYNLSASGGGAAYGNPWQLVWVFDDDPDTKVVCEGYSKAFQYLCDRTDFNNDEICAYCVSGYCGGAHMWNIIHMDDGKNYIADLTNCDNGTIGYPDKLFLTGYESIVTADQVDDNSGEVIGTIDGYRYSCGALYFYDESETSNIYNSEDLVLYNRDYSAGTPGPSVSPSVSVSVSPSTSPSISPSVSPSVSVSVSPSTSPSVSPSTSLSVSVSPSAPATATVTSTPTVTPTCKPTVTTRPTVTPTQRPSATITSRPTVTVTPTVKPSATTRPTTGPTVTPTPSGGSGKNISEFVSRLYTVALGRGYDQGGMDYWVGRVRDEGLTGARLAEGFLYSAEFLDKNMSNDDFLRVLYKTFFDREADEGGLNNWLNAMASGMDKKTVIKGFIDSTEWANLCLEYGLDSGGTGVPNITIEPNDKIVAFAERLYSTCLGRASDPRGLSDWASQLANRKISGTEAALGFFFSSEFTDANYSDDIYIERLYQTFLNRPADPGGYHYWMERISQGATRLDVFYGFADSIEFGQLCADAGIRR